MSTFRSLCSLAFCLTLLVLGGCSDDESLMEVESGATDPLFARYVAIGNSITAGFQSDGINAQTQRESYAVLLAERMNTTFNAPLLARPGCPPPLANALTGERIATVPGPANCALRKTPVPEVIHNVAVPGSEVIDVLKNGAEAPFGSNPNALTTILLGGRTQLEAAFDADPTFVSVWTGNNDVLSAALAGDTTQITPVSTFQDRYARIIDALENGGVRGGVLLGVADVTLVPALQPGAFYLNLAQSAAGQQALPDNFSVAGTCAPSKSGNRLVSFGYLGKLIARADSVDQTVALDCSGNPGTLTQQEIGELKATVSAYNQFIQRQADEHDFAYVNPNELFMARQNSIPSCMPNGKGCPDFTADNPFGPLFSLDGVHPTGQAHQLIADAVQQAIVKEYGPVFGESAIPVKN